MRDLHRMKDKVELSLDGRQLTGLVVVGLVLLGGAFALGQWYGKQQGRDEGTGAPRADILSALELIRASGTEPVIRVMAEAEEEGLVQEVVRQLADTIRQRAAAAA